MEKKICIISIIVENREESAPTVNEILGNYSNLFYGRLGIPFHDEKVNVISVVAKASTDEIGAVTGKLGMVKGVRVKSVTV